VSLPLDPPRRDRAPEELPVSDVPDLPHPVLGWRTWRVGRRARQRTDLVAPLAGVTWPSRQPMVASCGSAHTPPGDGCACGLYAVAEPGALQWGISDHEVLGVVALWGQIVEGGRGWRASHAYPRFVLTGPAIAGEQRAAISRRYGVPVHRSEVPPRDLAALLGAEPAVADRLRRGDDAEVEAVLTARMPGWTQRWHERRARAEAAASAASRGPRALLAGLWRRG
jgi:hypothetical protein